MNRLIIAFLTIFIFLLNLFAGDITAPTSPTNLSASTVSAYSITLTWSAATDASGIKNYRITRIGGGVDRMFMSNTTTFTDNTVSPSTTYSYSVYARDNAKPYNLSGYSNTFTVTTPASTIADNEPPVAVSTLSATAISPTEIMLSWQPTTDNRKVTQYVVYQNGAPRGGGTMTISENFGYVLYFRASGLNTSTTYNFTLITKDAAGNSSPHSNVATATTLASPRGPIAMYVDNKLASDITDGTYSVQNRSGGGSDGNAYTKIQTAINVMKPGDTILVRGGVYNEYAIGLQQNCKGTASAKNTIKGYKDEWVVIDGNYNYQGQVRQAIFWASGAYTAEYWIFENMEITGGGHPDIMPGSGGGFYLPSAKNCELRRLYIHHNYSEQRGPGATAGIILSDRPKNNIIEYCYLKANGEPFVRATTASAQIAINGYRYAEQTTNLDDESHSNTVRFNLMDGECDEPWQITSIGYMHKGFNRRTGYKYCDTQNPIDSLPNDNSWKDYGNKIHNNIIINSIHGMRLDDDYVQCYNNIIETKRVEDNADATGIITADGWTSDRRGSFWAAVYNNTIIVDSTIGLMCHVGYASYDYGANGVLHWERGFAVNNIIVGAKHGYDYAPISYEQYNTLNYPDTCQLLDLTKYDVSRNLIYKCNTRTSAVRFANREYTPAQIASTPAADILWKIDNGNSPFRGTTGAARFKVNSSYELSTGYNIGSSGRGGSHPYLSGVEIPTYIGAANPANDSWVDEVLGLKNMASNYTKPAKKNNIEQVELSPNYPNPFSSKTFIRYTIPSTLTNPIVIVKIYNILGQELCTLVNKIQSSNSYTIEWNAINYSSGIYFCRVSAIEKSQTYKDVIKLVLIK